MDIRRCRRCKNEKSLDKMVSKDKNLCKECRNKERRKSPLSLKEKRDLVLEGLKFCSGCFTIKNLSEFYIHKTSLGGVRSNCIKCEEGNRKKYHIAFKYNLTMMEFEKMVLDQNNKCKICNNEFTDCSKRTMHIDHCHNSEKVRGLLCSQCNTALGLFNDEVSNLENAIKYLKENG